MTLGHHFKNLLIIHKEKKRNQCLMSDFISDKDTDKLYVQFFRAK